MTTERIEQTDPVPAPAPDDGLSVGAVAVGVVVTVVMAGIAGFVHHAGSDPGERSVAGPWGTLGFTIVIAAPAVVAVIGSRSRPWVLGAAGVAQIPMLWLSFSPLFFPLWVPGVIFITQGSSMRRGPRRSGWQPVAAAASALLLVAGPACLILHQDPASWSYASGGGGSTSNIITATEATLAFACVVAAVVVASLAPPDAS